VRHSRTFHLRDLLGCFTCALKEKNLSSIRIINLRVCQRNWCPVKLNLIQKEKLFARKKKHLFIKLFVSLHSAISNVGSYEQIVKKRVCIATAGIKNTYNSGLFLNFTTFFLQTVTTNVLEYY
jgi:hypothetical protein